jgi:hypothetical protein
MTVQQLNKATPRKVRQQTDFAQFLTYLDVLYNVGFEHSTPQGLRKF